MEQTLRINIQSINDIVTNSSMEVYQEATGSTIKYVKGIINTVLKLSESDKSCDDLFNLEIDYENMYSKYFDYYISDLKEDSISSKDLSTLDKILGYKGNKKSNGKYYYYEEIYNMLKNENLIGNALISIEEFTDNSYKYLSEEYSNTNIKITPKVNCTSEDIETLNNINNLFILKASYEG